MMEQAAGCCRTQVASTDALLSLGACCQLRFVTKLTQRGITQCGDKVAVLQGREPDTKGGGGKSDHWNVSGCPH